MKFGDGFSTGSSMMPQKRIPFFELARGSGARALGDLVSVLGTIKGLPSGYSKDLQDDKRVLFNAVDLLLLVLPAMAGAIAELRFDRVRMRAAVSSAMMATDLADYLVKKGATFREAHGAVGTLVREAEEAGIELDALPVERFTAAHALFGADARDALGVEASLAAREIAGGTGRRPSQRSWSRHTRAFRWPRAHPSRRGVTLLNGSVNGRPFDLVIFDCDGVLVDSERIANRAFALLLREIGLDFTLPEMIETFVGNSMPRCVEIITSASDTPRRRISWIVTRK